MFGMSFKSTISSCTHLLGVLEWWYLDMFCQISQIFTPGKMGISICFGSTCGVSL